MRRDVYLNLLSVQTGNRVAETRETVLYVVSSLSFQCIVMCPLILRQQPNRQSLAHDLGLGTHRVGLSVALVIGHGVRVEVVCVSRVCDADVRTSGDQTNGVQVRITRRRRTDSDWRFLCTLMFLIYFTLYLLP